MPAEVGRNKSAQRRANHQRGKRRPRHISNRLSQVFLRRVPQHDQAPDGKHHCAAEPLHNSHQRELSQSMSKPAEQRRHRKDTDRCGKYAARAKSVRHPSADRDEHSQCQHVRRHTDVQVYGSNVEALRHLRQRRRDDRAVEHLHKQSGSHQRRYVIPGTNLRHTSLFYE